MEVSEDEFTGVGSDIELDCRTNELLDQDLKNYNPYLPLSRFEFGPEDYCNNFKKALATEAKRRTDHNPFPWQLEVALNSHLGCDGFLLAGAGLGKTLAMIMLTFLDTKFRVFIISPFNMLESAQVKQFEDWKLKTDIKNGRHQITISPIEAFLDPTRPLPIAKPLELTALGPQIVITDEAHCVIKWGPHFRPQYASIGTLKLLLTGESPFISATATANHLMQEEIKQSLRFGPNSFEVDLGSHRSNIVYSVHRLKNVSTAAAEVLDYLPSKTHIDGFTLIFMDSRKMGNQIRSIECRSIFLDFLGDHVKC